MLNTFIPNIKNMPPLNHQTFKSRKKVFFSITGIYSKVTSVIQELCALISLTTSQFSDFQKVFYSHNPHLY
jgi:hypothetical protein